MKILFILRAFAWTAVIALLSVLPAWAQQSTATIFGTVVDPAGAAIPNATVVLNQTEQNVSRTIVTGSDGSYRAEFLPVGSYTVHITAAGFKALDRKGLTLTVGQSAEVSFTLAIGNEGTTIEVTADVPLVNLGNSTLSRTVTNEEIDNLPLVNRNVYELLTLVPGVQSLSGGDTSTSPTQPLGFPETHVKINGSTDNAVGQVSYYLDGALNMTGLRNTGNPMPNPDAIREFKVETSNFSAQFGRSSGGYVTAVTKSGTNSFHGSLFEFYRTKNLNAALVNSSQKSPYSLHRFGGTIGGPVARDKLFFFFSYGGFRYKSADQLTAQFPKASQLLGDFSRNTRDTTINPDGDGNLSCVQTTGTGTNTKYVLTGAQSSTRFTVCDPFTHQAYAGNIIPSGMIDPTIRKLLAANLIPTSPETSTSYTMVNLQNNSRKSDEYLAKGDWQINQTQRLTATMYRNEGTNVLNPGGNTVPYWTLHAYHYTQYNNSLVHTWTLNNSTVNQLNATYTRLIGGRVANPAESLAAYGSSIQVQGTQSRSQLGVSGWFQAGNAITGPVTGSNIYGLRDLLSTTHGKHTLSIGGEINLEKDALQTLLNNYGVFAFAGIANNTSGNTTAQYPTQSPYVVSTGAGAGSYYFPVRSQAAITDFMFGTPNTFGQDSPVYSNANYWNFGGFFQDDWRITPRLTLNLGVRYDIQTTPLDTQRRIINFKAGVQSTVSPTSPAGLLFPGDPGVSPGGTPTEYNHVSPRFGLAWNMFGDGRTVLHVGGGIFYGSISGNQWMYSGQSQPYAVRATYKKVISVADPYLNDPAEFCANPAGGCDTGTSPYPYNYDKANPRYITPSGIIAVDNNYRWPNVYQMNVGLQQQLTNKLALTINYVSTMGRFLPMMLDYNYPIFNVTSAGASGASCTGATQTCSYSNTTTTVDNRRPLNAGKANTPTFSNMYVVSSSESSNYNGLQVSGEQRLTHGLTVRGYWVWSKSLQSIDQDEAGNTGNSAATAFEDANYRSLDRQRSQYDFRHLSTISIIYKTNYAFSNRWARLAVNGWTATAIWTMKSGKPFNITTGVDTNADGNTNDRPNLAGLGTPVTQAGNKSHAAQRSQWVSKNYFCAPSSTCPGAGPAGIDGTYRAYTLDGPRSRNVDASLFREFVLHESWKLQFRGEATNVFNLVNLNTPNTTQISSSAFGQITTASSTRIMQLGVRVLF